MARNSSVNLSINNRSDGFSITGGDIPRGITVVSGNMEFYGGDQIYDGQLLIGNSGDNSFGAGYLYGGSGIVVQNYAGSLTVHATGDYATNTALYNTGQLLYPRNNPSGYLQSATATATYATITNLYTTGANLSTTIYNTGQLLYPRNNPSGYVRSSGEVSFVGGATVLNGQLLIGSSGDNGFVQGNLFAGTGVVIQSGAGFLTIHATATGGGGGEANTASNLGLGSGIWAQKSSVDLQFKSLIAGNGLRITGTNVSLGFDVTGDYTLNSQTGILLNSSVAASTYAPKLETGNFVSKTETGVYATSFNLFRTGQSLQNQLYGLSGIATLDSETGILLNASVAASTYSTITNLSLTGSNLQNQLYGLSGLAALDSETGILLNRSETGLLLPKATKFGVTLGMREGSVISVGEKGRVIFSNSGQLVGWKLISKETTNLTLDVWKANGANPTNSNSITAAAKPALSAAQYASSTSLVGWNVGLGDGDILVLEVESNSASTDFTLKLDYTLN